MPEVIFNGPEGRLEGRYQPGKEPNAPIAIVLHPHPQFGGTMNNQIVYNLFYMFAERGFAVLRFNSRGVGRSQGMFDHGIGELSDAAALARTDCCRPADARPVHPRSAPRPSSLRYRNSLNPSSLSVAREQPHDRANTNEYQRWPCSL